MAKKFTFRLQPVLEQRQRAEEAMQLRVAAIERERVAIEDRLRESQRAIIEAKTELRRELAGSESSGSVAVNLVRFQASSSIHMVAKARMLVVELAAVHRKLDVERAALAKAMAARKAVELLKDKRYDEWKSESAKREVTDLDELAVMRHGRFERAGENQ